MKFFDVEVDVLTFQMSEVLSIFFRLKGFLARCFRLYHRWVRYLPMLITHSIVLSCFCFKTSLILLNRSSFSTFLIFFSFLFCIASDAKLSFAPV